MVYKILQEPMEQLEDLLPGIEEFLCTVLASEPLSPLAEEQRQFFLERLDIIKLPPSVPPRPAVLGLNLSPIQDKPPPQPPPPVPPTSSPSSSSLKLESTPDFEGDDFAAYQRELSRSQANKSGSTESVEDEEKITKVYDDIDPLDSPKEKTDDHEESMYEIPQLTRSLSESGYEKAKNVFTVPVSISVDNIQNVPCSDSPKPPPLPPRKDRCSSDAQSRSSIDSVLDERPPEVNMGTHPQLQEGQPPEVPLRSHPQLKKETSAPVDRHSCRYSDDQLDEATDETDGVSCESLDDDCTGQQGVEILNQLGVKLPRRIKKKRKHRKLTQSLSATLHEVSQPFHSLENISLSGELHYRSKLSWTRKLVALYNGRIVCYKPDKPDSRPVLVILLLGYEATFHRREGKRGFEIRLDHDSFESHIFLVDFKEWAEIWCEYINAAALGRPLPGPYVHLARGTVIEGMDGTYDLHKTGLQSGSNSNLSTASSDTLDQEPGTVKVKRKDEKGIKTARMGAFAFRATQFFESWTKKSQKKMSVPGPYSTSSEYNIKGKQRSHSSEEILSKKNMNMVLELPSPLSDEMPLTPEEPKRPVKHQGYLDVYSSFNKRKWGKRWCMIHENTFECYRNQTSTICELEFLLRNCILRRAIEETKSELGLMLMENNREKITIEPSSWGDFGPWLRILLQETTTPSCPAGLEAYMVEPRHYDDIEDLDVSRLSDPFVSSGVESPPNGDKTLTFSDSPVDQHINSEEIAERLKVTKTEGEITTPRNRNRDSGNCSADSISKSGSLERELTCKEIVLEPGGKDRHCSDSTLYCHSTGEKSRNNSDSTLVQGSGQSSHNNSSSMLPRYVMEETGELYTAVQRSNVSNNPSNGLNPVSELGLNLNEEEESILNPFESLSRLSNEDQSTEGGLMDEILSQFASNIKSKGSNDNSQRNSYYSDEMTEKFESSQANCNGKSDVEIHIEAPVDDGLIKEAKSKSGSDLNEEVEIEGQNGDSSLKEDTPTEVNVNRTENSILCSTFTEPGQNIPNKDEISSLEDRSQKPENKKLDRDTSKQVMWISGVETNVPEHLDELRTKLVELKKDRILIRDRKQMSKSETDKQYLQAEYNRLNRECSKVTEEIAQLEKFSQKSSQGQTDSESDIEL